MPGGAEGGAARRCAAGAGGSAAAVVFCVVEYVEALPSIVAILLEWVVAVGFLAGKRVGWLNPITGTRAGRAAHEGLDRALSFGGADVVLRAEIPVTPRSAPATQ